MNKERDLQAAFFENNPIAILVIDSISGKILDVNEAGIEFYGYEKATMLEMYITEINILPQEAIEKEIKSATTEARNFFLFKHKLASGLVKDVEVTTMPIEFEGQICLFSMVVDLTAKQTLTTQEHVDMPNLADKLKIKNKSLYNELSLSKTLLKNLEEAVVFFNESGIIRLSNASFVNIFSQVISAESISYEAFLNFLYRKSGENILEMKSVEAFRTVKFINKPIKLLFKGKTRHFLLKTLEIYDQKNAHSGRLFVFKEVTESVETERLRKQVEERYRNIFHNSPVGIISFDKNGITEEFNGAFLKTLGSSKQVLSGLNLNHLPNIKIREAIQGCLRGECTSYNGWYSSLTGNKRSFVSVKFTPLKDNNRICGGLGVVNDITAAKKAERVLINQKMQFGALFKNSPLAIAQFDTRYRVTKVNDAFIELYGYDQKESENQPLDGLLSNMDNIIEIRTFVKYILAGDSIKAQGIRTSKKGDNIDVDIIGIPIVVEGEFVGGFAIYTDIREQLINKKQLIRAKEVAESANEAKSNFLANMSHEIRTPMNGFMGMLELLDETDLNDLQRDYLEVAKKSASGLLRVVSDILDYSKVESKNLQLEIAPFDLRQLISDVIDLYSPLAIKKDLHLSAEYKGPIFNWYEGDSFRLKQVLSNLVSNAIKYTEKGSVTLFVSVNTNDRKSDSSLRFDIQDTGIGIPEDKKKVLFNRFVQIHDNNQKNYGGTGLGLAISKGLAQLMNGSIELKESSSKGSTFSFICELKRTRKKNDHLEDHLCELTGVHTQLTKRVLVADDDETSRFVITNLLELRGWEVEHAENGVIAIELCDKTQFDVILMDCQMPLLDGYDTARLIRKVSTQNKKTPIIALTAFSRREEESKCIESGMNYFFTKPVAYKELISILESL